jgi:hypothetical protein
MSTVDIGIEKVDKDRRKYTECSARLDTESMAIEIYCRSGLIFKKSVRIARVTLSPIDLYRYAEKGVILSEGVTIYFNRSSADQLLSYIKQYISRKGLECLSRHVEEISRAIEKRGEITKYIEEINKNPREKILELAERFGLQLISDPGSNPLEKIHSIFIEELKTLTLDAISRAPKCPEVPQKSIDRVLRIFASLTDLQDSVYRGESYEVIMKIVSSIEDQIGGFINDEKKKIAESLSRRDVVEITKVLIDVIRNSINRNIQYIISKDLS